MPRFVVRPLATRVLSMALWVFGWAYLTAASLDPALRLGGAQRDPAWLAVAVPWLIYSVHLLVGPLAMLSASTSLRVRGEELRVDRLFGLIRKTYSGGQIRSCRRTESRWAPPRVAIVFDDGRRVRFDAFAAGFQQLCDYLWPGSGEAEERPGRA